MRVIELRYPRFGLDAFVVIDHTLFPISAGGTRMLPDVEVDEVARLARAMTWKLALAAYRALAPRPASASPAATAPQCWPRTSERSSRTVTSS